MDDPELWKPIWEFFKSVVSDTLAPWVNRALPHLVSPALKMVRTHTPAVRRVAGNQVKDVLTVLRGMLPYLRNPWLWPMVAAIPLCVAFGGTPWDETAGLALGALASIYVCAAMYFILRSSVQRVVSRLR